MKWTDSEISFLKENYKYGAKHCAQQLNKPYNTVINKARMLNLQVTLFDPKYSEENLRRVLSEAKSYREAFAMLEVKPIANQYRLLRERAEKHGIDISHFSNIRNVVKEIPLNEILDGLHPAYARKHLKERLYKTGLKKHECELCGQGEEWHGKKMSLILDHKNGIRDDHRLDNLQIVCPNCNATLDTFSGKNRPKKEKIDRRALNAKARAEEQSKIIPAVLNSNIDFSKHGWVSQVAPIIRCKVQKVNWWMKKYMKDFYDAHCFRRR